MEILNSPFIFLPDTWKERKMKNYSRMQEEACHDVRGNSRKNGPEPKCEIRNNWKVGKTVEGEGHQEGIVLNVH